MKRFVLIAHDIRSTHNVGALLRTADGLGISHVYFTGYTPYPKHEQDTRLPHEANKTDKQIHKTALGAENSVSWSHEDDVDVLIANLKDKGFELAGLEQQPKSTKLHNYQSPTKLALVLGSEVDGLVESLLQQCDEVLEIPMRGKKESFNVVEAATMAMYHIVTS